jgi:putative ABC transport system permease protein
LKIKKTGTQAGFYNYVKLVPGTSEGDLQNILSDIFTAEQRSKEISIRKLLGANVQTIVSLLSKDFIKLVFIAALIASPIAWYFMNHWLQDFAYRVTIEWWIFIAAIIIVLLVAMITVSFQAIKAAVSNPVKS